MKKLWINALLSAMFISISIFVFAERREKEIKIEELPQSVQQFVTSHFDEATITSARIVKYGYHKVLLSDGYELLFDRQGKWLKISNDIGKELPSSIMSLLPQAAQMYMADKYPNYHLSSIERNSHGYEAKIDGTHAMKIHFDPKGKFINETLD
ncbi:MAG: PepSY-like domain-containing protein [Bacteroidaceae bacterium]|nr:PepSY-like domain-containing protein [Bacteroidaceae bacterium]